MYKYNSNKLVCLWNHFLNINYENANLRNIIIILFVKSETLHVNVLV